MSEKRLWVVSIETEIVVYAEDEEAAKMVGERTLRESPHDIGLEALFVKPLDHLPIGWDETCLPWSDVPMEEEQSIGQLVKRGAAPEWKR
jgi:hypothetical protein